ncbi:MAG: leucine-rich repeat domain-containing protein, partial [Oscillospiraceae bacterium]|nr:leucine-rich repeat domain-containing protein [Oscillospiraceae bacterium]
WCVCYGRNILRKPCEVKISTAKPDGGSPAIAETRSGRKQYLELFRFKKNAGGNGYAVTGFEGENKRTLIFPGSYMNAEVTAIAEGAFSETEIQQAVITDGIRVIEAGAFSGCTQLKQVVFPDTLSEISDSAFNGCVELHTAMLPKKIERIGAYAFASAGLKNIELPDSLYRLGEGAYSACLWVTAISIPQNVGQLCDKLFAGCKALKKVALPNKLTSIGAFAFDGCENLMFISVPDSVTQIGENAFRGTNDKFIIQCRLGSAAENYARKYKLKFQLL